MRANPEDDVAVQMRFSCNEITDHVVAHHLLVHRVGFDVFAIERNAFRRSVQPLQRFYQPA